MFFSPRYIPDFVKISNVYINTWCQKERVFVYPELRCLTFHVASKTLAGFNLSPDDIDSTMDLFQDFVNGLFSLPIQFPMSTFRKVNIKVAYTHYILIKRFIVQCTSFTSEVENVLYMQGILYIYMV